MTEQLAVARELLRAELERVSLRKNQAAQTASMGEYNRLNGEAVGVSTALQILENVEASS